MTRPLLWELFSQGGPVADVTLFETHAYVLFEHEESVPYCLALLSDIEVHGSILKLSPRARTKDTYVYVDYLSKVRMQLRSSWEQISHEKELELKPKKHAKQQTKQHTKHTKLIKSTRSTKLRTRSKRRR